MGRNISGNSSINRSSPAVYYVLLVQLGAYAIVAVVVLLLRLKNSWGPEEKPQDEYKWCEYLLIGFRILLSSTTASFAMLSGAWALLRFPNLPLLVMLPVSSLLFRERERFAYKF